MTFSKEIARFIVSIAAQNQVEIIFLTEILMDDLVSIRSRKAIRAKFRAMQIHKWRKPLVELAKELNPVIEGMIQYYHKFWDGCMWDVWSQLNHRLLKWVKWEKGLYKYASLRWLRGEYRRNPGLFAHWKLVQP